MIAWLALFFISVLPPSVLPSRADTAAPPMLRITGDTTLDSQVIARIAGTTWEPDTPAALIKKRLQDTDLFSAVRVSRDDHVVRIFLRQKITWFVFPYASSDPSGSYVSLAAGKAIIAHEDVFAYARYQAGTGDHEGNVGLEGRNILGSAWDSKAQYSFKTALKWTYTGRDITLETLDQFSGGSLGIAYRINIPWKVTLTNFVESHRFENPDGSFASGFQWSHQLTLEHNEFYSIDGLGQGHRTSISLEVTNPLSTFRFTRFVSEGSFSLIRDGDFDWIALPKVAVGWNLPFYQLLELGGESLRGYPSEQFRDRYLLALLNNLYLKSWTVWELKPRLMLFADWAFIQNEARVSAGGGIQIGVRNLLFSAVQVLGGYGFNPGGFAITFSLGQRFH